MGTCLRRRNIIRGVGFDNLEVDDSPRGRGLRGIGGACREIGLAIGPGLGWLM